MNASRFDQVTCFEGAAHVYGEIINKGQGPSCFVIGNAQDIYRSGNHDITAGALNLHTARSNPDGSTRMLMFAPPGSVVFIRCIQPSCEHVIRSFVSVMLESLQRVGIVRNVSYHFSPQPYTEYLHHHDTHPEIPVVPLIPSPLVLSEHAIPARAAMHVNNKAYFLQTMENAGIQIPVTWFPDHENPGKVSVSEVLRAARDYGASHVFLKRNVDAGGTGVFSFHLSQKTQLKTQFDHMWNEMHQARLENSDLADFHIQLGVRNIRLDQQGVPEIPGVLMYIGAGTNKGKTGKHLQQNLHADDGQSDLLFQQRPSTAHLSNSENTVSVIQISNQRMNGTQHFGNRVDPAYREKIIKDHGKTLLTIGEALYRTGIRGSIGVDCIISTNGSQSILTPIECNPRFTNSSRTIIVENALKTNCGLSKPVITTNRSVAIGTFAPTELDILRNYFFNPDIGKGLVITKVPHEPGDGVGLDFINDTDGVLEKEVGSLFAYSPLKTK